MWKPMTAVFALTLAGCVNYVSLRPAGGTAAMIEEGRTASVKEKIALTVDTAAWTGKAGIREAVIPLRVTIVNNSGKPVRVAYDSFSLQTAEGGKYAALPPLEIRGDVETAELAEDRPPFASLAFPYRNFYIAPAYSTVYPFLSSSRHRFYYNPQYYETYYREMSDVSLPTPEMLEQALPEGELDTEGMVSGFLYFKPVPRDAEKADLVFEMKRPDAKESFSTITIPLVVE